MLETTIRVADASNVGTTGLTGTEIKYRRNPFSSGDVITIAGVSGSVNGIYLCSFIGNAYEAAQLWISGVYQGTWGTKYIGDEKLYFVALTGNQTIAGIKDFSTSIKSDVIAEHTAAAGVTIDGALIKDNQLQGTSPIKADNIAENGAGNGVTVDNVLLKDDIYTGHTGRALLMDANNILVDNKRAADLTGFVYNDLDTAMTYAAGVASVNSRINIYLKLHIGSSYSLSQAIPDYVNLHGLGGMVMVTGVYTRSGSVALSSRIENIYFLATDQNHVIVRTIGRNSVWQTAADVGDGGTISLTTSEINNCGLFGSYADVGDDVTSGGTNKIINSYGNFNVTWQASDEMFGFTAIVGDTFSY